LAKEQSNEEAIFYRDLAQKKIRSASPGPNAARLYEQGVMEFSAGNYAAAVKVWRECLRLEPGNKKAGPCIRAAQKLMRGKNAGSEKTD
jgi:Flp pilus assembly protein TadD